MPYRSRLGRARHRPGRGLDGATSCCRCGTGSRSTRACRISLSRSRCALSRRPDAVLRFRSTSCCLALGRVGAEPHVFGDSPVQFTFERRFVFFLKREWASAADSPVRAGSATAVGGADHGCEPRQRAPGKARTGPSNFRIHERDRRARRRARRDNRAVPGTALGPADRLDRASADAQPARPGTIDAPGAAASRRRRSCGPRGQAAHRRSPRSRRCGGWRLRAPCPAPRGTARRARRRARRSRS